MPGHGRTLPSLRPSLVDIVRATRRRLPIGIQSFRSLRERDCYYVDKTQYVQRLLDDGTHFFLSRPRRFGKSLLLDTIKELFEGNGSLFEGLSIQTSWDWTVRYPVLRLSFGSGDFNQAGYLHTSLMAQLDAVERHENVNSGYDTGPERLRHLLELLHRKSGNQVAVLIDEYDKPILDALDNSEIARTNRDYLRGIYSIIKDADSHIIFSFITGVSKFSRVNLFSGLNSLIDITIDPRYSSICGYADQDLDRVFSAELSGLNRKNIRHWYNGYSWLGEEKVYNPFDILLLFYHRRFSSYWFETGTPSFLVKTLFKRQVRSMDLDNLIASSDLLSTFDVDDMATEALLFQTGYLTIVGEEEIGGERLFRLGYPNREVRQGLNRSLLRYLVQDTTRLGTSSIRFFRLLESCDFGEMKVLFQSLFASILYEWHTNNEIANYEGYYASVFYSYFAALGLDITVEDSSSLGRLDMAVRYKESIYLLEFKMVESASGGAAMKQLKARRYADKYRGSDHTIFLIGVEFSRKARNVTAFEV